MKLLGFFILLIIAVLCAVGFWFVYKYFSKNKNRKWKGFNRQILYALQFILPIFSVVFVVSAITFLIS